MPYSITFLLPGSGHLPIGGFRVVYQYSNALQARGHQVTIVHPAITFRKLLQDLKLTDVPKKIVRYLQRRLDRSYTPSKWFHVDHRVHLLWVPTLHPRYVPTTDVVIATAWQTAEWLDMNWQSAAKFCLVYDFEHYMAANDSTQKRIARAFSQPIKTIATSPAVAEMLRRCGVNDSSYIPCGIDFDVFRTQESIEGSSRDSVGFPARREMSKGTLDAIHALHIVRKRSSKMIRFWCFGSSKPDQLPDWIEFHEHPSDTELCELYNRTLVFAVPSHYEGWGLPGAEAMACGAALASTDNGGVRAYAANNYNALLSPPKDPDTLAQNIISLLEAPEFRLKIARQGHADIQHFTIGKAVDSLENLLSICDADACVSPGDSWSRIEAN